MSKVEFMQRFVIERCAGGTSSRVALDEAEKAYAMLEKEGYGAAGPRGSTGAK